MDILYSSSDSYAFLAGISILSLLENNQAYPDIRIYIMDNSISEENKRKLTNVVERYQREITFVPMPDMKELTGRDMDTRRWNISTFGRLYMAGVLPETVHKVLNIDCDTIIVGPIGEVWQTDLTDAVCGGMPEFFNDRYKRNIGMEKSGNYINGGVILLNLDQIRAEDYEQKFTEYISKYGSSLAYLDQDVLNGVIPQEKIAALPLKFNVVSLFYYASYDQVRKIRRTPGYYSREEFEDAVKYPVLVHFTTCFLDGLRPWIKGNRHPYLGEFLKYKEMSPWADMPLQEDNRSSLKKSISSFVRRAPRWFICEVASLLHGVIVPEQNRIRMKKEERNAGGNKSACTVGRQR